MASTAETTITIMYQFTHFFNVLKASLQEENEAIQQNNNQVLHVNTGPVDLQCGHAISTCVIVFMCLPVYIITVVEGNKTNVHPTQGKYGHKRQKGEPAASPLYTNKARMHTSIISILFQ